MNISAALLAIIIAVSSLATPNTANAFWWWAGKKLVMSDDSEKKDIAKDKGASIKKDTIKKKGISKKYIAPIYIDSAKTNRIRKSFSSNVNNPAYRRWLDNLHASPKYLTKPEKPKGVSKVISNEQIITLTKMSSEANGTVAVGNQLGKLNLSIGALENTYLRIVVHQNRLSKADADIMFAKLHGVPGFVTTLRKITGNNKNAVTGHLNELKIASHASNNGIKVLNIGERFNDGIKKGSTDIDLVFSIGMNIIALEAKDYSGTTKLPLDKFRSDLDSLKVYKKSNSYSNVIPVFSLRTRPNTRDLKLLEKAAVSKDVQLIIGTPIELIEEIKLLK